MRNTTLIVAICLGLACLALPRIGAAERERDRREKEDEGVDALSLAARLVADEHYDRATVLLQQVDPNDESIDRAKLHFLLGTIFLKKELYAQARDELTKSVKAGQTNRAIHIYLAQTHIKLGDHAACIAALAAAGDLAKQAPGTFTMRAEAHRALKQPARAIAALDEGIALFPSFHKLTQMKIGYLLDLGLYQEVVRVGEGYLARKDATAEDYLAIAEGLRRSKQYGEARRIMEGARLRFPSNSEVSAQLANTYLDAGHPLTAAMLYEQAAQLEPKYSFEAAELYKASGRLSHALRLSARIVDPAVKLKQRLGILLDMERFEMIAAMEPSLSRTGLLKDENIRYALAYGYFRNGNFESAEQHLKQISEAGLFDKAVALRKAMASCQEAGWSCY